MCGLTLQWVRPAAAQHFPSLSIHGGMGFTTTSYSKTAAEQSNTVSRGFGFQSILEPRLYNTIGIPIMIGWEYLGPICFDEGGSSGCPSRSERKTSLFFASLGAALYGPSIPMAFDQDSARRPFIIAGREWVSKGVGDDGCLNCTIESVRFDGGLFVEPGIELPAGEDVTVSLGYRMYYARSDLENRFVIRFTSRRRTRGDTGP